VLATTEHGAAQLPLRLRAMIARARSGREHPTPVFSPSANLCPGCGPVANELSSRFCEQHGLALRTSLASWRARSAPAGA
jgi:hypothetical protein